MKNFKSGIPFAIWVIGFSSLLINISSVMVFGVAALYVKQILGVTTGFVLMLEGMFEAIAYAMKLFSGVISDYLRRRKVVMVWGLGLFALARPVMAVFSSVTGVLVARLLDRFGNGIQSTPRDALVGDLAPLGTKGACFGLRQSLAVAGSFIGGFVGIWCMVATNQNFEAIFLYAAIPAVLGLLLVIFFVKDPHEEETKEKVDVNKVVRHPIHLADLKRLGKSYWILMGIALVFTTTRVGESVLVLHATESFQMDQNFSHGIIMLYNGANSLCSYPVGYLSDRLGRYGFLGFSFFILILADAFLGLASSLTHMMIGVALWGVQIGISQSMFLSLIADHVPEDLRGTGIGFFYLISSVALIFAGTIGGFVANYYDQFATFITSGVIGFVALLLLAVFCKDLKRPDYENNSGN
ncbi:MAG: MFS transporter [Proteobacteria bacterium]|nr:MFS transporter [Pseudomonadota bacterium]